MAGHGTLLDALRLAIGLRVSLVYHEGHVLDGTLQAVEDDWRVRVTSATFRHASGADHVTLEAVKVEPRFIALYRVPGQDLLALAHDREVASGALRPARVSSSTAVSLSSTLRAGARAGERLDMPVSMRALADSLQEEPASKRVARGE
jgi:hypothetical protein